MNKIRVCFAGDFCPNAGYEKLILEKGESIFGKVSEITTTADLSILNLECPITNGINKISKDGPNLKSGINSLHFIKKAGFNLVNLANNHIMDYGLKGLLDTIEKCNEAKIDYVGCKTPLNQDESFYIKHINNLSIAVIAVAEKEFNYDSDKNGVVIFDIIEITKKILRLRSQVDIILVSFHGGNEFYAYPRPELRRQCQYLIDLGVDAIVCHHVHVPGAIELYKEKPIIYSLGNFIYDHDAPPNDWESGYLADLLFEIKDAAVVVKLNIHPYIQSSKIGGISLLKDNVKKKFLLSQYERNKVLEDESAYIKKWNELVDNKSASYISWNYSPIGFKGLGKLSKLLGLHKFFYNKYNYKTKFNYINCDSHRELLSSILERKIKDFSGKDDS